MKKLIKPNADKLQPKRQNDGRQNNFIILSSIILSLKNLCFFAHIELVKNY